MAKKTQDSAAPAPAAQVDPADIVSIPQVAGSMVTNDADGIVFLDFRSQVWIDETMNAREMSGVTEEEITALGGQIMAVGGLLQPVGVIGIDKAPATGDKDFALAFGFRRNRALHYLAEVTGNEAKWLGRVMCRIVSPNTLNDLKLVQLIENSQKAMPVMDRARAITGFLASEECDISQEALAERLGMSAANLSQIIKLMTFPVEIQKLIDDGSLSFSAARELWGVPAESRLEAAKLGCKLNYNDFKARIDARYKKDDAAATGEGGETPSQRGASMLAVNYVKDYYVPFTQARLVKADKTAKLYTAADLERVRLDTLNAILKDGNAALSKEIEPFIIEAQKKEEAKKAAEEADKELGKFIAQKVKDVNTLLNIPPNPDGTRMFASLAPAAAKIIETVNALTAEQIAELPFKIADLAKFKAEFPAKLTAAWSEDRKLKNEEKAKKEAKKAADKAAAAAEAAKVAAAAANAPAAAVPQAPVAHAA